MRLSLALLLSLLPLAAHAQDYWCLDKRLSVSGDYGYIRRQEVRDLRLVEKVLNFQNLNDALDTKKLLSTAKLANRLGWESAIRGSVVLNCTACAALEGTFTYFYPWTAHVNVVGDGNLRFPFKDLDFGDDYENADKVSAFYRSRLQNGEANYWCHLTPRFIQYFSFSYNVGFRWIELKERMNLAFTKDFDTSCYTNKTKNTLYGLQLGAMLELNPSSCWTWTFIVKGAGFANEAKNRLKILDDNNTTVLKRYTKQIWTDSWLIEGYGQLAWHINSYFSAHFGYQGFLLTGVALAPNQRDVSRSSHRRISSGGQIVIDGMYGGLTISF